MPLTNGKQASKGCEERKKARRKSMVGESGGETRMCKDLAQSETLT